MNDAHDLHSEPTAARTFAGRFQSLSVRILAASSGARTRGEFLRQVAEILRDAVSCDRVDLWAAHGERQLHARCDRGSDAELSVRLVDPASTPPAEDRPVSVGALCEGLVEPFEREDDRSHLLIPLRAGDERIGHLLFRSTRPDSFSGDDLRFQESFAPALAAMLQNHRTRMDLRERVEALTCLNGLAGIAAQDDLPLPEALQRIVELLPDAWLYPDHSTARIVLDERVYAAFPGREGPHRLVRPIRVEGEERGRIEVAYDEAIPVRTEDPFLAEERRLIETVAHEISVLVERREADATRDRLREQLRHADRLATIGQLAAGVAHELNEPLGSILGFAQLAAKHDGLPEPATADLEKIVGASLRARDIVQKLLLFARRAPARQTEVDLDRVVEEGLGLLGRRFEKAGIEVVADLAPGLPPIAADAGQIRQVLVNLVVNAVQAMGAGGRLAVRTRRDGDRVVLSVEDTGAGMTEEVRRQIFLPFFTTKDVGEGTGLGLSVVHGIVTAHGGEIEVESAEGRGTTFTVRLPVAGPVAEPAAEKGERA